MRLNFTTKTYTSLLILALCMLVNQNTLLAQETFDGQPAITPPGREMELAVKTYQAGLNDLWRAYHDMPYTALAEKDSSYEQQWNQLLKRYDFDKLSEEGKVDYILLARNINRDQYDLRQQQQIWSAMQPALPFAGQVLRLAKMRHWGTTPDSKAVAATYDSIGKEVQAAEQKLPQLDLSAIHSLPAAMNMAQSLKQNLSDIYQFYNGYDPSFGWWVTTTYKRTDSLLANYNDSLNYYISKNVASNDGSHIPGVPIGKAEVERYLKYELIPYSPDELIDIANDQYAWCLKQMKKAAAELGYKDNWRDALEKVKNDAVPVGEQPALIDSLENEALDFVAAHHLIDIPPLAKETWTMKMMTPKEQLINPFFYGGVLISISYPTNTMSYPDKLMSIRGNNIYFARATVFHELLPGHYMQAYMYPRYRIYRQPFHTAFWTEGWAFYWEMLMWQNGFDKTPEQKIGALYWWMTRCARIVFTLNFHLGKWTPQQCVDYLVNSAGLERANAEAEVRRSFGGEYDPLYQIAYMIGALQFRALHHELVESGKMTNEAFHMAVLKENNMSIEMVRALLEHLPLESDYQPHWKFYQEIKASMK